MRSRRRLAGVVAGAAVLSLAVSGCSLLPGSLGIDPPPPAPKQGPQVPPYLAGLPLGDPDQAKLTVAADKAVQIDPCALQSQPAAEQASGQHAPGIGVGSKASECSLQTVDPQDPIDRSVTFRTTVGEEFDQSTVDDSAQMNVGGATFYKSDMGEGSCIYDYDLGSGVGITLQVSAHGDPSLEQQACRIGDAYLQATGPRYVNPPLRAQSSPASRVQSPCVAIRQALTLVPPLPGALPGQTEVRMDGPSVCEIDDAVGNPATPSVPDQRTRVRIENDVNPDPKQGADHGLYPAVTVAGRPGWIQAPDPTDREPHAELQVRADDTLIDKDPKNPGSWMFARTLQVQAPSNDQAIIVAQAVLSAGAQ